MNITKATKRHLKNMEKLAYGKETKEMYDYLDTCWICDKPITFWDRISFNVEHSFEGNSHRRNCE
jgi:hypothetical protein